MRLESSSGGRAHYYKKCHFTYYVMTDEQFKEMNNAVMELVKKVLDARNTKKCHHLRRARGGAVGEKKRRPDGRGVNMWKIIINSTISDFFYPSDFYYTILDAIKKEVKK